MNDTERQAARVGAPALQLPAKAVRRVLADFYARHRVDIALCAGLFASMLGLYGWLCAKLIGVPGGPYYHYDIWFGLDAPRVIDDMAVWSADHYRVKIGRASCRERV